MSKTVTVENYSAKDTETIVSRYVAVGKGMTEADHEARAQVVKELALEFRGDVKQVRSIRSKLVTQKDAEGNSIYIARSAVSKVTNEKPEKKEVIAQRVADAFGVEVIEGKEKTLSADSLEKMNKTELSILLHRFNAEVMESAEMDAEEIEPNENDSQEGETVEE